MDINTVEEANAVVEFAKIKKIEKLRSKLKWLNTYPKFLYLIMMCAIMVGFFLEVELMPSWQIAAMAVLSLFISVEMSSVGRVEVLQEIIALEKEMTNKYNKSLESTHEDA
jgi:hypothetical protein